MPIYDFKCSNCNEVFDDMYLQNYNDNVDCPKCKSKMTKLISKISSKSFPKEGVFLENVSAEGKRFYSEREMRDYQRNNNVELGYLL